MIVPNGFSPSYEQIAAGLGLASQATVYKHLSNLKKRGWIDWNYNQARSIVIKADIQIELLAVLKRSDLYTQIVAQEDSERGLRAREVAQLTRVAIAKAEGVLPETGAASADKPLPEAT